MRVKDTVRIEDVVNRLGLNLERHENSLLGQCPSGHESAAGRCFRVSTSAGFFRCFNCGVAGDIFGLVTLVKGFDADHSMRWLLEGFRPDLLYELERCEVEAFPGAQEYYQRAGLYELVFEHGKKLLYESAGKEAFDYLVNQRGYQVERLRQTEWIYWLPDKEIRDFLLSQHPEASSEVNEQIHTLELSGHFGDNFRSAIPYRDRWGAIAGFSFRATAPKGIRVKTNDGRIHENVRWDKTPGFEPQDLFNLNACRGYDTILMLEGLPDALILPTLGLKNVVALGNALLTGRHIKGLRSFDVKKVIISFDNEPYKEDQTISGIENTEIAVGLLNNTGIVSFVIDPPLLSSHKDPDEFVRERGIGPFLELVENAQRGATWKAKRIVHKHDIKTDLGRKNALDEALLYWWTLRDPIDNAMFKETLRECLGISQGVFDEFTEEYHKKKAKERLIRGYQDFFREGERLLVKGDLAALRELLDNRVCDIRAKAINRAIEPPSFDEYRERLRKGPRRGFGTGYPSFDRLISIPLAATTIIAARRSHGKTTFLLNLFLNMVRFYKENAFFYFSFEHSADQIISRVINILSDHVFDNNKNIDELEKYLRSEGKDILRIEKAVEQFKAFTEGKKRLWIMDEPCFIDELEDTLSYLSKTQDIGAIFIDCIQDVRIKRGHETRGSAIERISERIAETSLTLKAPLLLGVRLKGHGEDKDKVTMEDIRAEGDIVNDAHMILGLFNPSKEKEQEEGVEVTAPEVDLMVTILKNKDGPANVTKTLKLHRPTHIIREPEE
jgi:DNA primase/replicative DNA helicase